MIKNTLILSIIGIIFQVVGVFYMIDVAKIFGANGKVDAYYYVLGVYFFFTLIFQNVLKSILMPVLMYERKNNINNITSFYNGLLSYSIVILTLVTFLIIFISQSDLVFYILPKNSSIETYRQFFILSAPVLFLSVIYSIFSSIYNSIQKFGLLDIFLNLRIIISYIFLIILYHKYDEYSLIIGNLIGLFMSVILTFFYLQKIKLIKFKFEFKTNLSLRKIFMSSPIPLIASIFTAFQPMVSNYFLGTYSSQGSLTILSNLQKIASIPTIIFTSGFLTVFLTQISKIEVEKNNFELKKTVSKSISAVSTFVLPTILLLYIIRNELIQVLFKNSKLTEEHLEIMSNGMTIFLFSFYFLQIYSLLFRIYVVKKLLFKILFLNVLSFICHYILTFVFVKVYNFDVIGTIGSMLLSNAFTTLYSFYYLHKKFRIFEINHLLRNMFKTLLTGFIIFILSDNAYHQLAYKYSNKFMLFTISYSILFVIAFFFFTILFKNDDILYLKNKVHIILKKYNISVFKLF